MHPLLTYLRRYLWIDGRAGRREWWTTMVLCVVLGVQFDVMSVFALPLYGEGFGIGGIIRIALSLLLFWIDLASTVRRVHDRGKSGWSALPFAFPGLGWMWMVIECGMLPSQKGRNRYGPVPGSIEEERERPSLPEILASFKEQGARGPWSTSAARSKPATLKHVRFKPDRSAAQPAMARERTRAARQPMPRQSAVIRVAESNQSRGKTILIIVAATILGLAVAIYMADEIGAHQSGKPTTTPERAPNFRPIKAARCAGPRPRSHRVQAWVGGLFTISSNGVAERRGLDWPFHRRWWSRRRTSHFSRGRHGSRDRLQRIRHSVRA